VFVFVRTSPAQKPPPSSLYPRVPTSFPSLLKEGLSRFELFDLSIHLQLALPYNAELEVMDVSFRLLDLDIGSMNIHTGHAFLDFVAAHFKSLTKSIFFSIIEDVIRRGIPSLLKTFFGSSISLPLGNGNSNTAHIKVLAPPVIQPEGMSILLDLVPGFAPWIGMDIGHLAHVVSAMLPQLSSGRRRSL
jgi:hypothetical protein